MVSRIWSWGLRNEWSLESYVDSSETSGWASTKEGANGTWKSRRRYNHLIPSANLTAICRQATVTKYWQATMKICWQAAMNQLNRQLWSNYLKKKLLEPTTRIYFVIRSIFLQYFYQVSHRFRTVSYICFLLFILLFASLKSLINLFTQLATLLFCGNRITFSLIRLLTLNLVNSHYSLPRRIQIDKEG